MQSTSKLYSNIINSKKSYKNIPQWINEIYTNSNPDIKIILVGNKVDLEPQ